MSEPTNYKPLTTSLFHLGQTFGPVAFRISQASHHKSLGLHRSAWIEPDNELSEHDGPDWDYLEQRLFPSELWGWARALCPTFGRLNEVMVISTSWSLHHDARPDEPLTAISRVVKLSLVKGLPMVTMETTTRNAAGQRCLVTTDDVILLHDCPDAFYQPQRPTPYFLDDATYTSSHRVFFRHVWDPAVWQNNIHTDQYARRFGFERGLPEFIMYCDWSFFPVLGRWSLPFRVTLERIRPLYEGEMVGVSFFDDGRLLLYHRRRGAVVRGTIARVSHAR